VLFFPLWSRRAHAVSAHASEAKIVNMLS
jgi:hypothetical protein